MPKGDKRERRKEAAKAWVLEHGDLEKISNNSYRTHCPEPEHPDENPSCDIDLEKGVYYCHICKKGGSLEKYVRLMNFIDETDDKAFDDFVGLQSKTKEKPQSTYIATYIYHDESGKPAHIVDKYLLKYSDGETKKTFPQSHYGPDGRIIKDMKGVKLYLYNLPAVMSSSSAIIVEGEKDCETLKRFGYVSTTNVGGAGKWLPEYNEYLKDKEIILVPDNDTVGYMHANTVAASLWDVNKQLKIVKLIAHYPELPNKADITYVKELLNDRGVTDNEFSVIINKIFRETPYLTDTDIVQQDIISLDAWGINYHPVLPPGFSYANGYLHYDDVKKCIHITVCEMVIIKAKYLSDNSMFVIKTVEKEFDISLNISDKKTLAASISQALGTGFEDVQIKMLQHYLANYTLLNKDNILEIKGLSHTGMTDGKYYIPSNEYDGIRWTDKMFTDSIYCSGSPETCNNVLRFMMTTKASIVVLASLAAPLLERLGIPNLIIYIHGLSNTGKSCACLCCLSLYGQASKLRQSWNSTKAGRELLISLFSGLPVLLDEVAANGKDVQSIIETIYHFSQGHGKLRGTKTLGIAPSNIFSGTLVSTGEMPLQSLIGCQKDQASPRGVHRRVIEISADETFLSENIITGDSNGDKGVITAGLYKVMEKHFGYVGSAWAIYVDNNIDELKKSYQENLKRVKDTGGMDTAFAALLTVLNSSFVSPIPGCYAKIEEYVFDVAASMNEKNIVARDVYSEFIDKFQAYVLENKRFFINMTGLNVFGLPTDPIGIIGKVEGSDVIVMKEAFNTFCNRNGFIPDDVLEELKKNDKITKNKDGYHKNNKPKYSYTDRIRLYDNQLMRCYHLKNVLSLSDTEEDREINRIKQICQASKG
ncbi:MAG: DUF927 domain-containing protein [Nitrospirae bacterium]|nr:DUF927 domain-containing protein [Nitrospirota bacterium]